ncbi:MAG: UPF0149 family protein [Betaproteobacteria bacterium]|nr:UPF0149 family protein [Betaproteobacteria bacterium]
MALVLRHMVGIQRTLAESPTRFRPLLYLPEEIERKTERKAERKAEAKGAKVERTPPEASAWCEATCPASSCATTSGSRSTTRRTRDWIFPIEALAFGDREEEFTEWVDSEEKRQALVEELPVAAVLIYRFWLERGRAGEGRGARRGTASEAARKSRQRLH